MTMQDIGTLVSSVGFPIVSFLIACYALKYSYDKSFTQIMNLTESVNNNTLVLTKLVEKLDRE